MCLVGCLAELTFGSVSLLALWQVIVLPFLCFSMHFPFPFSFRPHHIPLHLFVSGHTIGVGPRVVLFASTLGILMSMPGQTIGVGPFTEKLLGVLPLTRTQLTLAYLIGTVTSGLILPFMGRLYDKIGVRKLIVATSLEIGRASCRERV